MSTENNEKEPVVKTESKDYYYAVQNGKKFLKHRPVKRNPKEWTEEQKFIRNRISGTSKFASKNLENLIHPVWKFYKERGISGYPLFMKHIKTAFGSNGSIIDYTLLPVTMGILTPALNVNVKNTIIEDSETGIKEVVKNSFDISWDNEEPTPHSMLYNFLSYALIDENEKVHLFYTDTYRNEKQTRITLEDNHKYVNFIYIFFRNKELTKFSNSVTARLFQTLN